LNTKPAHKSKVDFDAVLKLGAALPGVKASSGARGIALKLKGQTVACTAINPSAEPNTLMVCIDFPVRDALLERQPAIYYMTAHYRGYATVLVRLAEVGHSELRTLLEQAVQFVSAQQAQKTKATGSDRRDRRGDRASARRRSGRLAG
jgi:hypothetical protein